jgi:hypothetical protein
MTYTITGIILLTLAGVIVVIAARFTHHDRRIW